MRDREDTRASEGGPTVVARGPGRDTFRGASRLERALLPYLREQTLWPVLVAVLAHVIALVAPLLVLMVRDGHGWATSGIGVLVAATAAGVGLEVRDRGYPGMVTMLLAAVWLLCGAGAVAAVRLDLV